MKPNAILTEIRQTRDDLARETGYDLKRHFDYVREQERQAAARGVKFVFPAPREKGSAYALREEPSKKGKWPRENPAPPAHSGILIPLTAHLIHGSSEGRFGIMYF